MDMQSAGVGSTRAFRLGDFLRDQLRNIAPFITLIALVAFFSIASPTFASLGNLVNILQQVSVTAIIAVGLTFVILTAEIDLSVGAIANATAIVLTFFTLQPDYVNIANLPMPGAIAIILALLACFALGLITAFGVTRIGIPSFIMTLAMMQIGAGVSAVLVRGQIAYTVPPLILTLGSKSIFGVPWIIIVAAIFLLVAHLVLTYTRFGRYVYMVGGNREAAEYSGVNVRFIIGAVMVISAMCSGFAGMIGSPISAAPSRTSSTPSCSTPSPRWWSAARACSAGAAASATRSLASSCSASSTTASTTSRSTASSRSSSAGSSCSSRSSSTSTPNGCARRAAASGWGKQNSISWTGFDPLLPALSGNQPSPDFRFASLPRARTWKSGSARPKVSMDPRGAYRRLC